MEKLSGKKYALHAAESRQQPARTSRRKIDIAFRVIADHIRTLSFAIADGIQPGNTDRNYVLRRILRRAVRYGRTLGFHEPFFYKLVDVLADTMGDVFPELPREPDACRRNAEARGGGFNRTLDKGIALFEAEVARLQPPGSAGASPAVSRAPRDTSHAPGTIYYKRRLPHFERPWARYAIAWSTHERHPPRPQSATSFFKPSCTIGEKNTNFTRPASCPITSTSFSNRRSRRQTQKGNRCFTSYRRFCRP